MTNKSAVPLVVLTLLLISHPGFGQAKAIVTPTTAADLRQLCKSFEYVALSVDLGKKDLSMADLVSAQSCINFIVGVVQTVASMDVGYYPDVKISQAKTKTDSVTFRNMVKAYMNYLDGHSELEQNGAVAVVVASFLQAGLFVPKHWADK